MPSKVDGANPAWRRQRSIVQQRQSSTIAASSIRRVQRVLGFPVAVAAQKAGIQYIGMRNEQSASYARARSAVGYLNRPARSVSYSMKYASELIWLNSTSATGS